MNYRPRYEDEIVGLRVRRTVFGKLVVQIRRQCKRPLLTPLPSPTVVWEDAGLSTWRDANGNDVAEIAEVVALLSKETQNA